MPVSALYNNEGLIVKSEIQSIIGRLGRPF